MDFRVFHFDHETQSEDTIATRMKRSPGSDSAAVLCDLYLLLGF